MITLNPGKYASIDMKNAIEVYNGFVKNKTQPTAQDLENPFITYIHIIHLTEKAEPNLHKVLDWIKFYNSLNDLFANALRYQVDSRCLFSSLNLLQAWMCARIARIDQTQDEHYVREYEKYFARAKKYEAKADIEYPISGGKVHHYAAQIFWATIHHEDVESYDTVRREAAEDVLEAVVKGFDYAKFVSGAPMQQFATALIRRQTPNVKCLLPKGLADLTLEDIVTDEYIYDRSSQDRSNLLVEYRSETLSHYLYALMLLNNQQYDLAMKELWRIGIFGERSHICDEKDDDSAELREIKLFWQELLMRDYSALISKLFDALVRYNRNESKQARQALRDKMLTITIEVDSSGKHTEDRFKIAKLKADLLPLLLRLAGTDLSSGQMRGMSFSQSRLVPNFVGKQAMKSSVTKLVLNMIKAFVETVGISRADIDQIDSAQLAGLDVEGEFNEEHARGAVLETIRRSKNVYTSRFKKDQPLLNVCKPAYLEICSEAVRTPVHNLMPLAKLELALSEPGDMPQMIRKIDAICQGSMLQVEGEFKPYDYYVTLSIIMNQKMTAKSMTLFAALMQNGKLDQDTSLFTFDTHCLGQSDINAEERRAVLFYLIGLQLFAKEKYELGTYYLAQAYLSGNQGELFYEVDHGFCHDLFADKNWGVFYAVFNESLERYCNERNSNEIKMRRKDYSKQMLLMTADIDQSNQRDDQKIAAFKEKILPMLLFLAGLDLGKSQRAALRIKGLKQGNLCKATKRGLNIAVQLLGLTAADFAEAKAACKKKMTQDVKDLELGINVSEAYFNALMRRIDDYHLNENKFLLIHACRPYIAQAVGYFARVNASASDAAKAFFLGAAPSTESFVVEAEVESDVRRLNKIAKSQVIMDEVNIDDTLVKAVFNTDDEESDVFELESEDDISEIYVPRTLGNRKNNRRLTVDYSSQRLSSVFEAETVMLQRMPQTATSLAEADPTGATSTSSATIASDAETRLARRF